MWTSCGECSFSSCRLSRARCPDRAHPGRSEPRHARADHSDAHPLRRRLRRGHRERAKSRRCSTLDASAREVGTARSPPWTSAAQHEQAVATATQVLARRGQDLDSPRTRRSAASRTACLNRGEAKTIQEGRATAQIRQYETWMRTESYCRLVRHALSRASARRAWRPGERWCPRDQRLDRCDDASPATAASRDRRRWCPKPVAQRPTQRACLALRTVRLRSVRVARAAHAPRAAEA